MTTPEGASDLAVPPTPELELSSADLSPVALPVGTFCGMGARVRDSGGIRLTESVHGPHLTTPRHTHGVSYFCYVLAGGFEEQGARGALQGVPGTVIFHPADVWHTDRFVEQPTRCLNVEVPDACEAGRILTRAGTRMEGLVGGRAHVFAAELARELAEWDTTSSIVVDGLVLSLAAVTARETDTRHGVRRAQRLGRASWKWVDRAAEMLRTSRAAPPTSSDLAAMAGVSVATIHRGFLRRFGCTIGEFVRRERIEAARRALLADNSPLAQIALVNGFADQAHFTRLFRRATGWTPAAYRRMHQQR